MIGRPPRTSILESLPATVPFVAPEEIERRSGRLLRLRLGANESSFGVSPRAREAMLEAVERVSWYGDPSSHDLRARIAELHGVSLENVCVGAGIDDLLGVVVRCFIEPGQSAVASLGSYPTFAYHVLGHGGALHRVPYRADRNDLEALLDAATHARARLLYLANPDNPSGTWHSGTAVAAMLEHLPAGCLLVLDEAYIEFAADGARPHADAADPRLVRLRTFSKVHGMAGARIGYAIGDPDTIAAFDKVRLHFGVNLVAQAGALAALEDGEFVAGVVAAVAEGRRDYAALGRALGLPTLPSATNFVAFDVGGTERARALLARLLEQGVFVRMPGAPPLDRCIRVTVGTAPERAAFADTLRRLHAGGFLGPHPR